MGVLRRARERAARARIGPADDARRAMVPGRAAQLRGERAELRTAGCEGDRLSERRAGAGHPVVGGADQRASASGGGAATLGSSRATGWSAACRTRRMPSSRCSRRPASARSGRGAARTSARAACSTVSRSSRRSHVLRRRLPLRRQAISASRGDAEHRGRTAHTRARRADTVPRPGGPATAARGFAALGAARRCRRRACGSFSVRAGCRRTIRSGSCSRRERPGCQSRSCTATPASRSSR